MKICLQERRQAFADRFEATFHLREKMQHDVYDEVGKHALSNMLGSMGYFRGYAKVVIEIMFRIEFIFDISREWN